MKSRERFFPWNLHLYLSPDTTTQGVIDSINPVVEMAITIPSLATNGHKLILGLLLRNLFFRGVQLTKDEQCLNGNWFSVDLPNSGQKLRARTRQRFGKCRLLEML